MRTQSNGIGAVILLGAIVVLSIAGIIAVVVLTIVGVESRSTPAIVTLLAFLAPTIGTLLNAYASKRIATNQAVLNGKVDELHDHLDTASITVKDAATTVEHAVEQLPPEAKE